MHSRSTSSTVFLLILAPCGDARAAPIMSLPTLTTHNHTSFIANHALVLVLYASPWCAHRQRLLPTLAMAAGSLPDNVAIALCEEPALAEAAGVIEMPSLRLHRPGDDGDLPEPFEQDTPEDDEAGAIADYLLRSSRTTPLLITSREGMLHELSSAERFGGVTAVLFGAELDGVAEEVASLRQVARQAHWRGKVRLCPAMCPHALCLCLCLVTCMCICLRRRVSPWPTRASRITSEGRCRARRRASPSIEAQAPPPGCTPNSNPDPDPNPNPNPDPDPKPQP